MTIRGIALVTVLAAGTSVAAARDQWIRLQTAHVTIASNASERETANIARRLEQFIQTVSPFAGGQVDLDVPLTVVVFDKPSDFQPFRPRQNGRIMNVSGYFERADDENVIALALGTFPDEHPYRVIFHEYAHALMARSAAVWPLWLVEGLAEFYSTFEPYGSSIVVGQRISSHARLLVEQPLLPLQALFAVDRASALYNEKSQNLFYAESWALVEYLAGGNWGGGAGTFRTFLAGLADGKPADGPFDEAIGQNRAAFEEAFRRFVSRARYPGVTLAAGASADGVRAPLRTMAEADVEVLKGSLLMRVGRADEASPYFARAAALNPTAARLEESLGFLALNQGRYDDAIAHLERAIAQEPGNALAHYYYAETLRRRVTEQGRQLSPEVAIAMADPLKKAIDLRPSFARAYYLLGYTHLVTGRDLQEGVRALETAIRLAPPNRGAMLTLASVHLKMKDYVAAIVTARKILDAPDASDAIKAEARQVMDAAARKF